MRSFVIAALAATGLGASVCCADGEWKVLPCFGGGYVQNVVIAPSNPNVWYAYVDVGGPYRSDDAGRHWRPLHGNLEAAFRGVSGDCLRSMSVDPRDADSFVMCSGNDFSNPAGIFVSRDGGKSFRRTWCARFYGNGPRRSLGLALSRNPNNPDELLAGEDWDGIALSTDNGETWQPVGQEGMWFTDIRHDLVVPGRVYACALPPREGTDGGRTYAHGLLRSDDGGRTWRKIGEKAPNEICQMRGDKSLVGYFDQDMVRRSLDGGLTWEPFNEGLPACDGKPYMAISPGNFLAFGAGSGFWLAGDGSGAVYRRGPGDPAWTRVEQTAKAAGNPGAEPRMEWLKNPPMHALGSLIVDPRDDRHWLATDWYEIWESVDAGATWTTRIDGIMQLVSFTIEASPHSPTNLFYGVADMGSFASSDGGATWRQTGGWNYACSASYSHVTPGLMMMVGGKGEQQVRRSYGYGRWWQKPALRGLPAMKPAAPGLGAYTVAANPAAEEFLVCVSGPVGPGKGGIYITRNAGDDWEWFGEGLPKGVDLFKEHEWGKGGPFPQLYFGADGSAVCYSAKIWKGWYLDRATSTWRESKGGAGICAADPFRPSRFLRAGKMLSESLDGGATFHPYTDGDLGPSSFVSFDAHTPGLVVAGISSNRSVAVSRDGGLHWNVLPGSERVPSGSSSKVLVDRKRLFYLTTGSGVFTRRIP